MQYTIKSFSQLTGAELYGMLRLRQDVFIIEQACIYPDLDDHDQGAHHLLVADSRGTILACARILARGTTFAAASIGRVAVSRDYRRQGIASELMRRAMDFLRYEQDETRIQISAQSYAIPFYEALGFQRLGAEYLEDGIPHVDMCCDLTKE